MLKKTLLLISILCLTVVFSPPFSLFAQDNPEVEQLDFANGLFRRGMYKMAIDEYKKFIDLFPESGYLHEAYFGLAESHYFLKGYERAIAGYKRYIEKFPKEEKATIARLRIGESLFFAGKFDDAIRELDSLPKEGLDNKLEQTLYFYKAKAYRAKGDKEQAIKYFEMAVTVLDNGEYGAYSLLELGEISTKDADYEKALEYFNRAHTVALSDTVRGLTLYKIGEMQFASRNYEASAHTFKKVLKDYPENELVPGALSNMLLSLFNSKRHNELITEYSNSKNLIKEENSYFDAYLITAAAYAQIGDYEESISIFDTLISSDWLSKENKEKALLRKCEILLKTKRFDEALEVVDNQLAPSEDKLGRIIFLKAEAFYGLKRFKEADAYYTKLIESFPESPFVNDTIYALAFTQRSLSNFEGARDLFMRYFNEEARNEAKRQSALYNVILLDIKLGAKKDAVEHSRAYLSDFKDGNFKEKVLLVLAQLYSEIKEYDKAIETYREFISLYKESEAIQEVFFLLGYNLQLAGQSKEALEYYEKVKPEAGKQKIYTSALKNMSLIYFSLNDEASAAKIYKHLIDDVGDDALNIDAYLWLVKYYLNNRELEDAMSILEKATAREDSATKAGEISYFKGEVYRQMREYEKAISEYEHALSVDKGGVLFGASRIGKALSFIGMGKFDSAKSEFETAIEENANDNTITMRARFELARIEQFKGNLEEAAKLYLMVAILYENDAYSPRSLLEAAKIFDGLEMKEEADKAYKELLDRFPDSPLAEEARERLHIERALKNY